MRDRTCATYATRPAATGGLAKRNPSHPPGFPAAQDVVQKCPCLVSLALHVPEYSRSMRSLARSARMCRCGSTYALLSSVQPGLEGLCPNYKDEAACYHRTSRLGRRQTSEAAPAAQRQRLTKRQQLQIVLFA